MIKIPKSPHIPRLAVICILIVLQVFLVLHVERVHRAEEARTIRIATPSTEAVRSSLSPYGPGFELELTRSLARNYGLKIIWVPIKSWTQGWNLLRRGKADILIGPGLTPPSGADRIEDLAASPTYAASSPVVVHPKNKYGLNDLTNLCSRRVLVQNIQKLPELLREVADDASCGKNMTVSHSLKMTKFLDHVESQDTRFGMADERLFSLWQPFYTSVRMTKRLEDKIFRRWYWRTNKREKLPLILEAFWMDQGRKLSAELGALYFGFLPSRTDYYELYQLQEALQNHLPQYSTAILKAARENRLDPLFLTAVIYQESRFDPFARSKTGVRGLMQISSITADHLGIENRLDPIQSIFGGAGYLRDLYDQLDGFDLPVWDRWFAALGAYNQGMGHTRDAIRLAKREKLDHRRWRNIRKAFKQLSWKRYYSKARHGYARGYEAAHYVRNIRYFYYVLKGLSVLAPDEFEDLAALAGGVPAGWPD